ncbi:MAG TPA: glycosyltransferase family 39 protein, partial [Bacteroidia bacterium]|nr:glycosyltransferase family 39 protein [Bacteroidia bacterium]
TGIFFSKLFGFSFTLLRFISIACVLLSTLIIDANLKRWTSNRTQRLFVLLLFVFNPLTLSLGNSFLPDVFQLFLGLLCFHFLLRYLEHGKSVSYLLLILFCVLLTLNRQTGLLLPLIFAVLLLGKGNWTAKKCFIALLPLLLTSLALFLFGYLAKEILPQNYNLQLNNILNTLLHPHLSNFVVIGYYFVTSTICFGLFILPLSISSFKQSYLSLKSSRITQLVLLIYLLLVTIKCMYSGNLFPFVGNIFYHVGVGPVIMTGFNTDEGQVLSLTAKIIWILLNFVGAMSFFISMQSILKKQEDPRPVSSFFKNLFVLYLVPLCFSYANDRYLLFLLPFYLMAYVLSNKKESNKLSFLFLFLPLFYFGLAGSHDYMALNRARMQATDYLVKEKQISPQNIDGGFEFNAWHATDSRNYKASHTGRWWFVGQDEYIISPVPRPGYTIERSFPFKSWMSFSFEEIFVLSRDKD